jgi:uncharacterized RDD family membrane protein YckC
MSNLRVPPPPPPMPPASPEAQPQAVYASFGRRLGGLLVDMTLTMVFQVSLLVYALVAKFSSLPGVPLPGGSFSWWTFAILPNLFFATFLARSGRTPGMRLVRVKLLDDVTGSTPDAGKVALRTAFAFFISGPFLAIGYIWAAFHPENKTLHDVVAGTSVVDD